MDLVGRGHVDLAEGDRVISQSIVSHLDVTAEERMAYLKRANAVFMVFLAFTNPIPVIATITFLPPIEPRRKWRSWATIAELASSVVCDSTASASAANADKTSVRCSHAPELVITARSSSQLKNRPLTDRIDQR